MASEVRSGRVSMGALSVGLRVGGGGDNGDNDGGGVKPYTLRNPVHVTVTT